MSYLDKINVNGTNYDIGKPLYCHGVTLDGTGYQNQVLCFSLITNKDTSYDVESFKQLIKDLAALNSNGVLLNADGNIYNLSDKFENTHTGVITCLVMQPNQVSTNEILLVYVNADGSKGNCSTTFDILFNTFTIFTDRFHKIN